MRYEFAPIEGLGAFPLRRAHAACFPGTDRYYTPFLAANETHSFKTREKKEISRESREGMSLIPQILSKDPEAFRWSLFELAGRGFAEVNFNLGCPAPTVVTRGRGSAMLADPEGLLRFFDAVFSGELPPALAVSVKTRTGFEDPGAAGEIIRVLNRFPFSCVIVHPRLRTDFYLGHADVEAFSKFYEGLVHPVIYNGDIRTAEDAAAIRRRFPAVGGIMIGRGLLVNPALIRQIRGGEELSPGELRNYHERVLEEWLKDLADFGNVIGKMKELWFYMGQLFPGADRELKAVRKARTEAEYRRAADGVFLAGRMVLP